MKGVGNTKKEMPILKNDERMYVYLQGSHFQQNNVLTSNNIHVINKNVINICCVYKLNPIASSRDTTFTIQNAKNADNSKNSYKGYGIYVMGSGLTQGIHDITLYAEKNFYRNFTGLGKNFLLSLHYNGDDSYLFVNRRQELKFKCKTDQLVKEKLCIGNLSDQWTTSESEKTGVYGKFYDFVVDYEEIVGVKAIYDLHRYLMLKHNISP